MSGLAAAVRMARFGGKVCVLERHNRVGGLNSFYKAGGYNFDVGLHAMTNYFPDGPKSAPLNILVRQLRLRLPHWKLVPQKTSKIVFPDATLEFGNGIDLLEQKISEAFPAQVDNFHKLIDRVRTHDIMDFNAKPVSGREMVSSIITDPYLVEMILCPLMFYGSSEEDDMEFSQFATLFTAIYLEGFARPEGGVRTILNMLVSRLKKDGGDLRLKAGVKRVLVSGGTVKGVELDSGDTLECGSVISSAGLMETIDLCPESRPAERAVQPGNISFVESINVLDQPAVKLGVDSSIIFYNNGSRFHYHPPSEPVDVQSGVICFPGNFCYDKPLETDMVRATHLADHRFWMDADEKTYDAAKEFWRDRSLEAIGRHIGDLRGDIAFSDMFTPRTVKKFTGHINGTVYGSPDKVKSGLTQVKGLFLSGTDQGYLGIVGAMVSGVLMANHIMKTEWKG